MAEGKDVREETSITIATRAEEIITPAAIAEDAAPAVAEASPIIEAPPIAETAILQSAAPILMVERPLEPAFPEAAAPAPIAEPKLPPAPQLTEPAPTIAPTVTPPPLRREPEMRPNPPRRVMAQGIDGRKANIPPPREKAKSRFPLLAATLALAAGLGGAAGAVGIPALISHSLAPTAAPTPINETVVEIQAIKGLVAQLGGELGALKAAVEQSNKVSVAQLGKVAERLDRAERGQAEPAAKLAKIGEALERLEKRVTPPPAPAPTDVTGTVTPPHPPAPEAKPKPTIIEDYVVRRVFDGVALIEGRRGIIEVEPGTTLPGAGRVEEIRRQDGRWVVVTTKGLIVPPR
jgi:hypothetical protein